MPSHTPGKRTIRFACRNCTTRLSAPLRAAGKTLRCPYCFTELVVPKESATVQRDGYELSEATEEPFVPTTEPAYITVVCPVCATRMYTTKDQIGQTMTCPDCGATAEVREPDAMAAPEPPRPVTTGEYAVLRDQGQPSPDNREVYQAYIPVVCPTCETRMLATEHDVGQEIVCPDCQTHVRVPPLAVKAPSQLHRRTAEEREDAYDVGGRREGPSQPEFLLVCGVCHVRLYATPDQVGREILCPDCYTPILVPEAPAATEARPEAIEAYDVATSSPPPPLEVIIPGFEPIVDEGPIRSRKPPSDKRREREPGEPTRKPRKRQESAPLPPLQWAFFSGVFNFPFYGNAWKKWMALSAGMLAALVIAKVSAALGGSGEAQSFLRGAMLVAIIGLSWLVWFAVASACLLAIIQGTAAGADELEPSEVPWYAHILEFLFPLIAFFVSAMFGGGINFALHWFGLESPWITTASAFFLFPPLILSMVANSTPFSLINQSVIESMRSAWHAWVVFYLLQFLLGAGILAVDRLLSPVNVWLAALGFAVFQVWAMMVYGRLLGRLAFYCGQENEKEVDER